MAKLEDFSIIEVKNKAADPRQREYVQVITIDHVGQHISFRPTDNIHKARLFETEIVTALVYDLNKHYNLYEFMAVRL